MLIWKVDLWRVVHCVPKNFSLAICSDQQTAHDMLAESVKLSLFGQRDIMCYTITPWEADTLFGGVVDTWYFAPNGTPLEASPFQANLYSHGKVFYFDENGHQQYWNGLRWGRVKPFLAP